LRILKQRINIVCVKTGTKYSSQDVKKLYKMVNRNTDLPFVFYCLTDNVLDLPKEVVGVKIDPSLDLESYWWKMSLFNLDWDELVLYLDLDVIIQNNIDYIFKNADENKIKILDFSNIGIYYPFDGRPGNIMTIPQVTINSSVMLFNPVKNKFIFDKFKIDIDYNIITYYGFDRFIQHNTDNLYYFDFNKDYYCRAKGVESYDQRYIEYGLIHDPRKTFCIMNQCKPEHYIGLEKYFI